MRRGTSQTFSCRRYNALTCIFSYVSCYNATFFFPRTWCYVVRRRHVHSRHSRLSSQPSLTSPHNNNSNKRKGGKKGRNEFFSGHNREPGKRHDINSRAPCLLLARRLPFRCLLPFRKQVRSWRRKRPSVTHPKCDDCAAVTLRVDPSSDPNFAQKTCMRWFSRSQTTMFPLGMTAMPSSPLNSPSPEPHWPKARRKEPSGWKICMRLLPESPTMM